MKGALVTIVVLLFLNATGQVSNEFDSTDSKTNNSRIKEIRRKVYRINADSSNQKVISTDVPDQSAEGGEMKEYYSGENLCKATVIFFGETGKSLRDYYFDNDKLIFIYERLEQDSKPIYDKAGNSLKLSVNRYYFRDLKLFRWQSGDKIINSVLYPANEKKLLADMDEFMTTR